jgi:glycosyltransferase involved in cell wall biosynthesis
MSSSLPLRLSIAMTTYNGSQYVLDQIECFARQTLLPDELVVCDDCSSDDTVGVVRRFAAGAPFEVRVSVNETNLGYTQNFARAIGLTTGDIIFMSDQDDIWHPEKLRRFADVFTREPQTSLVMCDANLVESDLKPRGERYWHSRHFGPEYQWQVDNGAAFQVMIKNPEWIMAGATMAFPARLKPLILPIPLEWTYDTWISVMTAAAGPVALIREPLNDYRQHPCQTIGIFRATSTATKLEWSRQMGGYFQEMADRFHVVIERLARQGSFVREPCWREIVEGKISHWSTRARTRQRPRLGRLPALVCELLSGRYHHYSKGLSSMAHDLLA